MVQVGQDLRSLLAIIFSPLPYLLTHSHTFVKTAVSQVRGMNAPKETSV